MNNIKKPKERWDITLEKSVLVLLSELIKSSKEENIKKSDDMIIKFDNKL